jgi:Spy/CpxP family protein refolding chaperone
MRKRKSLVLPAALLATFLFTSLAFASGSYSTNWWVVGGGGGPISGGGYAINSTIG